MAKNDYYAPLLMNWIYPPAQRLQGRDFYRTMNAAVKNQFQFVQKKPDLIELKVIPKDASFGPVEEEFIRAAVRKIWMDQKQTLMSWVPGDPFGMLRYVIRVVKRLDRLELCLHEIAI